MKSSGPAEYRKVERLAWTEPNDVLAMISEIVASLRMGKDSEWPAIEGEPLRYVAELFGTDS